MGFFQSLSTPYKNWPSIYQHRYIENSWEKNPSLLNTWEAACYHYMLFDSTGELTGSSWPALRCTAGWTVLAVLMQITGNLLPDEVNFRWVSEASGHCVFTASSTFPRIKVDSCAILHMSVEALSCYFIKGVSPDSTALNHKSSCAILYFHVHKKIK